MSQVTNTLTPQSILYAMADRARKIPAATPETFPIYYPQPAIIEVSPTTVFKMGRRTLITNEPDGQRWEMTALARIYVLANVETSMAVARVDMLIPWLVDIFDWSSQGGSVARMFPDLPGAAQGLEKLEAETVIGDLETIVAGKPAFATDVMYNIVFRRYGEFIP